MPVRWVICPVVDVVATFEDEDGVAVREYRAPKVAVMTDPGRGKGYQFSAVVGHDSRLALCMVRGVDFGPLNDDPEIIDLLEADRDVPYGHPGVRGVSLRQLVGGTKLTRVTSRLAALGLRQDEINLDRPARDVLQRVAERIGARASDIDQVNV